MKRDQASECGGCGSEERWLLHNVRHRGIYRRLCTSCVLKFHAGSFCPICFEVYEESLLPNDRVMCLRCPSVSHLACVSRDLSPPYVCPTCLNPSFVFFDAGASNKKSRGSDGGSEAAENQGAIDFKSAKVLVAAARIALVSMSKAATDARIEAERRVKEAALARKRVREALERVVSLAVKEKEKGKDTMGVPNPVTVLEQKKKSKVNSAVVAAVMAQKRFQDQFWAEGNDKSGGAPVSLNNGDSREKERLVGIHAPNIVQRPPMNGVSIEDRDKLKGSPAPLMGRQQLQNPDKVNEKENSSNLSHLQNHVVQGEKEKNGLFSVPPVAGQLQHPPHNNYCIEEDRGKSKVFAGSGTGPQLPHSSQDALVTKTNSGVVISGPSNMAS